MSDLLDLTGAQAEARTLDRQLDSAQSAAATATAARTAAESELAAARTDATSADANRLPPTGE